MKDIIKKDDSRVFLAYKEPAFGALDVVEFTKLKGNLYKDTKQGFVRFYKAGNYRIDKYSNTYGNYVNIQFRKVVGKYIHLNTVSFSIDQLREILDHLNK